MLQPIRKSCQFGTQTLTLETGRIARQADGAVLVTLGDVTVLATVVGRKEADPNAGFFPLTVEYQEKTYAAGRIPGGFFRREGRPTEKETLTARLIDRPIRPLFPKGFMNEIQVICSVLSASSDQDPDIAALIGSSAALAISGIPFDGPIGAARVGMVDGEFVLNPDRNMLDSSKLDMVVAGTATAVLMVESEADQLSEAQMLDAVLYAHNHYQAAIALINELAEATAKPRWPFVSPEHDTTLHTAMLAQFSDKMQAVCDIREKMPRYSAFDAVVQEAIVTLATDESGAVDTEKAKAIHAIAEEIKSNIMRTRILNGQPRIDGRDTKTVRNLSIETGVLDRVHGSALFTRGETQALVVTTLGAERDAQLLDTLEGVYNDNFMFHYNFPPFCVGETGRVGSPKRREIGHGRLARRGVTAVMPDLDSFGYTVRVVSEITESNGSSSMASVCGASLSMMDAGIPLKAPVAGVAMGLIKEGDTFAVLTDIIGDEDHLGDMDFKVAGTQNGVTALQMDIKIQGITADIMRTALAEALAARLHILTAMNAVLDAPRQTVSPNAPIRYVHRINKEKKRDLIGKGGETVKSIQERTGSTLDIKEDGQVIIFANNKATLDATIEAINAVVCEPEVGAIYPGKVVRVEAYGAFIEILPGQKGLLHVSEMADTRVENVHDYVQEGQTIDVRLINIDEKGRLRLSRKGM